MKYALNAVMVKSRVLWAKRLTAENYTQLIACKNVNEMVAYLRTRTAYASSFRRANSEMSTFQVEELLSIHLLETVEKIGRYDQSSLKGFYNYILITNDIQQLLIFLRFFCAGEPEKYLSVLPPFLDKRSRLDLYALAAVRDYDSLLSLLKNTAFYKVLLPFREVYRQPESYLEIETAFNRLLWETQSRYFKSGRAKRQESVAEMIKLTNDMAAIERVYRLKRMMGADIDTVKKYISLEHTNFTQRDIEAMLSEETARDMLKAAAQTYYKKYFTEIEFKTLEDFTQRVIYKNSLHALRYGFDPNAVMLAYVRLLENEIKNIIHILESKQTSAPPEAVSDFLVGAI